MTAITMVTRRLALALLAWAAPVAAQQAAACSGPGAAFGVTAYQCASCGMKQGQGLRTQYQFQAEPIVLEAAKSSMLKAGDVIEAVNGDPITTQAGADRFTYPAAGPATITVRRGNSRVQVAMSTAGCEEKPKLGYYATGINEPLIVIDGVVQPSKPPEVEENLSPSGRRFGFAISCAPSCTRVKTADGSDYYKFDGYPPIVAVTPGGAAERAGIRVGDLVTEVDGKSILTEEGALRFLRGNKTSTLHLTVMRDRLPVGYLLRAR